MTQDDSEFPAVSRLQEALRHDLLEAGEKRSAGQRTDLRRFARPLAVIAVIAAIPATFAMAELRSEVPEDQPVAIDRNMEPVLCPDGEPLVVRDPLIVDEGTSLKCPDGTIPGEVAGLRELESGTGDAARSQDR